MFKYAWICSVYNDNKCNINKKSIMRYLINGIVDIVKLCIVLYAMWWCYDQGIITDVIEYFSK